MVGSPWLSKPIKKPMKNKQEDTKISLCPHCNCMTHTIEGLCGKCMNTKIKPDWEDLNKQLDTYWATIDKTEGGHQIIKEIKPIIYKAFMKQEEQHKKEKEFYEKNLKIHINNANEVYKLKQQHREELEGLKMKRRELELVEPRLFQSNPTLNERGGYSSVPFYCSLCFMSEMDIQDNKLGKNYHCHCSMWDSPTGGKWLKWFDEKKARQCLLDLPGEHNAYNEAIDEFNKAINNLLEQKGK